MSSEASRIILEIACPTMGAIMANLMFSAPARAVQDAVKRGYLGDLNPTPWAFMTGNCVGWVAYSFQLRNFYIFIANCPGFIASVWFNLCAAKLQSQEHNSREMRQSVVSFLEETRRRSSVVKSGAEKDDTREQDGDDDLPSAFLRVTSTQSDAQDDQTSSDDRGAVDLVNLVWQVTAQTKPAPAPHEKMVMIIVFLWTTLMSVVALARFSDETGQMIVGVAVNLNLLFFYGAPLSTIYSVVATRNSASIHVWTMITNTLNASFWTAYGIAIGDYFIYVPNGIGAGLGAVQVLLLFVFPRKELIPGETNMVETETENAVQETEEVSSADSPNKTVSDGESGV